MKISHFKFLYIKNKIKKFKKYNWESENFNDIMNIITNKDVILLAKNLLNKLGTNTDISSKKFLSSFVIIKNVNLVITNDTELENNLVHLSNILIYSLNKIFESKNTIEMYIYIKKFNKIYNNYIECFDLWKTQDELNMINNLSLMYFDLETDKRRRYNSIDNETNNIFIDNITTEQQKLVEKIELIGGEEGLEYLNSLKEEIESYKDNLDNLYSSIDYNMHQAYWNSISKELNKNPPDFYIVINLLSELKEMFLKCNPNLDNELDSNIDTEFIKEMLDRGVIDDNYIMNMSNYIINKLRNIQSEEHDKELEYWAKDINELFKQDIKYNEYFPMFFRYIFEKISVTQREMYLYNYIKQKREGVI